MGGLMMVHYDPEFYRGKRVFVTGHTGFKGSWLCKMLLMAGAEVTGYSLQPPTQPNLFSIAGVEDKMHSVIGDIRDFDALKAAFDAAQPDIVLHLAAQPIVRDSYKDPRYTYETNVMGTVNLLECVRLARQQGRAPRSVLNVTTDKVRIAHLARPLLLRADDDQFVGGALCGFEPRIGQCPECLATCHRCDDGRGQRDTEDSFHSRSGIESTTNIVIFFGIVRNFTIFAWNKQPCV